MLPPIHIFRAGTHIASDGTELTFSAADVAATASAYDTARHEAPLVIGHPATDAPAYGWVASLSARGEDLEATPSLVSDEFADAVRAGRYRKISASFYLPSAPTNPVPGTYYLRHVGFLGAQPPAVKGLRPVELGEDDGDAVTLTLDLSEPEPEAPAPESLDHQEDTPTVTDETTPIAELEAENASLRQQIDELRAAAALAETQARHERNAAFADRLVTEARLESERQAVVVAALDALETAPADFGEGEGAVPLHQAVRDWLAARPPLVDLGEQATREAAAGGSARSDVEVASAARRLHAARMDAGRPISYAEAVDLVHAGVES